MDAWLAALDTLPTPPSADVLAAWLARAPALPEVPPPTSRPYARHVLRSGDVEVMVARWAPGAEAPPHDHFTSLGVVRIVAGRARHRRWRVAEDGVLPLSDDLHGPGDAVVVRPLGVHSLGDTGAGDLVTLHVYAGPISEMALWDPTRPRTVRVRGSAGAWLPPDPEDVLEDLPRWRARV